LQTKAQTGSMADLIIFRCPHIGMNVQTDLHKQEIKEGEHRYESVVCPACTKLHFINRANGRTLGQDK
jgi:CxxC motif-containing protein (DUF1111 family)